MIACRALRLGAAGQPLTPALDCELPKGSLLTVIAGFQKPLAGKVRLSVPLKGGVSFLPQQQHLDRQFPISLQSLVAAGFWGNKP